MKITSPAELFASSWLEGYCIFFRFNGTAMGSILYDFLNESFLLQPSTVEEMYRSVSDDELRLELEKYREHSIANIGALLEEGAGSSNTIRLFASKGFQSIDTLMQAAFYLDSVILPDPLFPIARPRSDLSDSMNEYLGMPQGGGLDRKRISEAAKLLILVRPMVAANYVRFFPVSYITEPAAKIPVRYSPTQFAEFLPTQVLQRYRNAARVNSLTQTDGGWIVKDKLEIGRGIAIHFESELRDSPHIFNLFKPEVLSLDEESGIVKFGITLPEEPPSDDEFNHWVSQSINSAARANYDELQWDLALSTRCNAMYMTNSALASNILDTDLSASSGLQGDTTKILLDIDVPFLRNVSMGDLMIARADESAFDLFRRELERQFRDLRTEKDPSKLNIKIENAIHELTEVQVTQVEQKVKRLRKKLAADATIAIAGLAGSVVTSGSSLLVTLLAVAEGYKTVAEYQKDTRENPAYFLWKAKT